MGKDILFKAFRCEETDIIPWVPFVGCHAGKLNGLPADKFLRSEEDAQHEALDCIAIPTFRM